MYKAKIKNTNKWITGFLTKNLEHSYITPIQIEGEEKQLPIEIQDNTICFYCYKYNLFENDICIFENKLKEKETIGIIKWDGYQFRMECSDKDLYDLSWLENIEKNQMI